MPVELVVPKVGESITQVEVGDWLKKDGDVVARDETLVVLESEKTTVELPSPVAGVIRIVKPTGETVEIGTVLAVIEEGATGNGAAENGGATGERRRHFRRDATRMAAPGTH
jgi:2-oxoglutarate dehydrogenase E2 component (dihydrolipoamide succinyltransferase)